MTNLKIWIKDNFFLTSWISNPPGVPGIEAVRLIEEVDEDRGKGINRHVIRLIKKSILDAEHIYIQIFSIL